ncbi:unnamed protein product [Adineta ricciae]|uniref:Uncharacterized protein n=1 Tax=Adineta ricciae TaxID=249248 RepID=A0A814V3C3_ADIRI|nr:unnamed protein product [Adineta ricciae]
MGSTLSNNSIYTKEDVEMEIVNLTPRLPMAELMNGGIIKLQGANGFFNPNSLLDASWLQNAITVQDYREAINYINQCTAHAFIGFSKLYSIADRPIRENLRTQAGTAAVKKINEHLKSVEFVYQQTTQMVPMSMTYSTDPVIQSLGRYNRMKGESQVVLLYIRIL